MDRPIAWWSDERARRWRWARDGKGKDARGKAGRAPARVPVRREPSSCMHGVHSFHPYSAVPPREQRPPASQRNRSRGRLPWPGNRLHIVCTLYPRPGSRGVRLLAASWRWIAAASGRLAVWPSSSSCPLPRIPKSGCALACASIGQPCVHASGCAVDARTQRRLAFASVQSRQPTVRWSPGPDC